MFLNFARLRARSEKVAQPRSRLRDTNFPVWDLTVDRPHDGNYKMFKFKNTYTQDNRQLFQIIGQIHGKMLLNIDLFTLSCG